MSTPLLELRGVGKAYQQWDGEWRRVASWFGLPLRPRHEHWVLQDVNFSIRLGETCGIVGGNGAGKSTLLKLITGTAQPSAGTITTSGKLAAILELGMGFNPELTARENVIHVAGMMGIETHEITSSLPFIEDFSEVGDYFDRPLRTFSSGMQMRVAFALATARRPDLLIVDEALSVGDEHFQHKCFARIREFRDQGTSLLIVSHDHGAIRSLCSRAILLEQGKVLHDGTPNEIFDYYRTLVASKDEADLLQAAEKLERVSAIPGTGEAQISQITMLDEHGKKTDELVVGRTAVVIIEVAVVANIAQLIVGMLIKDRLGQAVFGINTHHHHLQLNDFEKGSAVRCDIRFPVHFCEGTYSISVALSGAEEYRKNIYEWTDLAAVFRVVNPHETKFAGICWAPATVTVTVQPPIESVTHVAGER